MILSTLTAVALSAAWPSPAAPCPQTPRSIAAPAAHEVAWVQVTRGRAVLLGSASPGQDLRAEAPRAVTQGRSQLELPTGSEARIHWPGAGSVRLTGPTSIEWGPLAPGLEVRFHEVGGADLELRSGEHRLHLPCEWEGAFGRSAFRVRGLPGGACEVHHEAGRPLALQWEGTDRDVLPPLHVRPGSSVRLDRPRHLNAPAQRSGSTGSWGEPTPTTPWPWSRATAAGRTPLRPAPEAARAFTRGDDGPGAPSPEAVLQAQVPVVSPPPSVEIEVVTRAGESVRAASSGAAVLKAQPARRPAPGHRPPPFPKRPAFSPDDWRGFERTALNHAGAVVAERCSDVEYRVLGQGRCKIIVSRSSSRPRWCFTERVDLQMQPGSVAIIEADGTLRMSFGTVQEFEVPADRPGFEVFED